jgi:predicted alpha/beta-fold hydrolase
MRPESTTRLPLREFIPYPGFQNGHAQTILGNLRLRRYRLSTAAERRELASEPGVRIVTFCHWQSERKRRPTVIIIHGLEGSADAGYVLGTSEKAFARGFNVIRCNVRNCGGTEHLATGLYHSGLTSDIRFLISHLIGEEGLSNISLIGFSMGGNQALKLGGELGGDHPRELRSICAISPPIDLESCSRAIGRLENRIYEYRFLRSLKAKMRRKHQLFPGRYDLSGLAHVRSLWDFDEVMSPYNGFQGALDYYERASSLPGLPLIKVPTLIIHAQDDPFIPFDAFTDRRLIENESITLLAPKHGGHVAFFGRSQPDEDCAWAENRSIEFCELIYAR